MLRTLFASIAAGVSAVTNSTTNGVTMSLDTSVLQQAELALWHSVEERINKIHVPDLVSKKDAEMYAKDNDFRLSIPVDSFYFNNFAEDNCMRIKLRHMDGKFTVGNFHAHYGIFGAYGTAQMKISNTKIEFGYRLIK